VSPQAERDLLDLAASLERNGRPGDAEARYRELIEKRPDLAVARFNFACFLRRTARLEEALREHQHALDLDIEHPEEVLSNMAVIEGELHRHERARALLERALAIRATYIPALYNLALLHEEFGDLPEALSLFNRILDLDPAYHDALIRIAHLQPVNDPNGAVVKKLRRTLRRSNLQAFTRESLHYALGKTLDDCSMYDEAFAQFELANRSRVARLWPYDLHKEEKRTAEVMRAFTAEWLARAVAVSERPLIFITGMLRSGSTLFEQVLAAHPRVTAGGEIHYFFTRRSAQSATFPATLATLDAEAWRNLGSGYIQYLDRIFPGNRIVTNKRPDAFALLGALKGMFPRARFINTVRHPLDTCLSIYFQQLDDRIAYAGELKNIAHHYLQYRSLMDHWKQLFGDSIFDAVYDEFVVDPRRTTRDLLGFLDLEWHDGCLTFQRVDNRVRTASLWQVREPVYRKSSGRWRNYERHVEPARRLIGV
jgi:tetratricopeptide (TPR) repeat protein